MQFTRVVLTVFISGLASTAWSAEPQKNKAKADTVARVPGPALVFPYEPSVRLVQAWAVKHAGFGRRRMLSMNTRVRRSAWLPELGFRVIHGRDATSRDVVSLELDRGTGDTSLAETRAGEIQFEATVRWRPGETIYHPEEIDVSRENRYTAHARQALLRRVTELFFQRRRLQFEAGRTEPEGSSKLVVLQLKIEQFTAEIDGLTGGGFSRHILGGGR